MNLLAYNCAKKIDFGVCIIKQSLLYAYHFFFFEYKPLYINTIHSKKKTNYEKFTTYYEKFTTFWKVNYEKFTTYYELVLFNS